MRLVTRAAEQPDRAFWAGRVARAVAAREQLGLLEPEGACRLIGGDADGLPGFVADRYADTLVLRENGKRVANYRLNYGTGQPTIKWQSATDSELRDISMEYLLGGVSWRPTYDMWVGADTDETVALDYFAEITDSSLDLDDVDVAVVGR